MIYTNSGQFKTTHGMCSTGTYRSWVGMKDRCTRSKASNYALYGGRGISVCKRWLKFENFYADMGERPENKTLDRIDTNGNYEPSNCRWATKSEQALTRRAELYEIDGIIATLTEHANRAGIPRYLVSNRRRRGWLGKDLLLKPQKRGTQHAFYG